MFLQQCSFRENSVATACVIIYWKNVTGPYHLVNFSAMKLEIQDSKAQGSIDTDDGFYHIIVFAYSNNMISGEPVARFYTKHETSGKYFIHNQGFIQGWGLDSYIEKYIMPHPLPGASHSPK